MRSSLADPDRERGAPVFDPDVTSVMDESRPAGGKTQLFQLPIIWQRLSAVLHVGVTGSLCRQKRKDTGGKVGHVLPRSQHVSTGCNFPVPLSFLKSKLYTLSRPAEWEMFGCRGNTFPKWNNSQWLDGTPFFSCKRRGQAVSVREKRSI